MKNNPKLFKRILSLDVFRGLTIVLMILVNSQTTSYPLLMHSTWNGCTLADLVFPWFLFIVGLTTVINLNQHLHEASMNKLELYTTILQRSLILFILGLFLNAFPNHFHLGDVRVYGILQRIAVCYLVCAVLYLNTKVQTQFLLFLWLLLGYWFVMTFIPVPGYGANQLTETGSWDAYIDQKLFPSNLLSKKLYDPEGLFSTVPAIATTLLGMLTGEIIRGHSHSIRRVFFMLGLGSIFALLAWLWNFTFPINKVLWTSSFVLWSGGLALLVFAWCYLIIDVLGFRKWSLPLKIFGMNALFVFVFHVLLLKLQLYSSVTLKNGSSINVIQYITKTLFGVFDPQNASLLYAFCFILLNFLVACFMYRQRIFIRT